ncbi:hypothetical protein F5Y08DRAFT_352441 [Xylaria arbuscula]|nr:hypothetical protein F5Y08DRAFT_352441 [Xylaria arbuscula]
MSAILKFGQALSGGIAAIAHGSVAGLGAAFFTGMGEAMTAVIAKITTAILAVIPPPIKAVMAVVLRMLQWAVAGLVLSGSWSSAVVLVSFAALALARGVWVTVVGSVFLSAQTSPTSARHHEITRTLKQGQPNATRCIHKQPTSPRTPNIA